MELLSEEPLSDYNNTPITQHEMMCILSMLWESENKPMMGYNGNWHYLATDENKEWKSRSQLLDQCWEFTPHVLPNSHFRALGPSEEGRTCGGWTKARPGKGGAHLAGGN